MAQVSITGGAIVALAIGVAGLYVYTQRDKILKAAVAAVNPADPENVVNIAANKAFNAAVGSEPGKETSIGSWLYDLKAQYFPSEADKVLRRWAAENKAAGALNGLPAARPGMSAEAWIGLAGLAVTLYAASNHKKRRRNARH